MRSEREGQAGTMDLGGGEGCRRIFFSGKCVWLIEVCAALLLLLQLHNDANSGVVKVQLFPKKKVALMLTKVVFFFF